MSLCHLHSLEQHTRIHFPAGTFNGNTGWKKILPLFEQVIHFHWCLNAQDIRLKTTKAVFIRGQWNPWFWFTWGFDTGSRDKGFRGRAEIRLTEFRTCDPTPLQLSTCYSSNPIPSTPQKDISKRPLRVGCSKPTLFFDGLFRILVKKCLRYKSRYSFRKCR